MFTLNNWRASVASETLTGVKMKKSVCVCVFVGRTSGAGGGVVYSYGGLGRNCQSQKSLNNCMLVRMRRPRL